MKKTFNVNERAGLEPVTDLTLGQLLKVLDDEMISRACIHSDDDLAEMDIEEVKRITRKALYAIGRMARLFQ